MMRQVLENIGAGEGNRTLVFSLEGCCSTIELHPRTADQLSRHGSRLNRHAAVQPPDFPRALACPYQTCPQAALVAPAALNRG